MNFKPELLAKVLDGTKTQTRRIVKPGHQFCVSYAEGDFVIDSKMRVVYHVHRDYAACPGRGKFQQGRIRIFHLKRTVYDSVTHGYCGKASPYDVMSAAMGRVKQERFRNER